jgi:hypothetical protein
MRVADPQPYRGHRPQRPAPDLHCEQGQRAVEGSNRSIGQECDFASPGKVPDP